MHKYKISFVLLSFTLLSSFIPNFTQAQTNPNATIEDAVRFYFADIPIMIDIARCETGFRQYNADGSALHDRTGTYVGVFQIAESIHSNRATSMGFDIRTIDGNLQYSRYLYNSSGTNPWKGCLPKQANQVAPISVTSRNLTVNLRVGMSNPQVKILQSILNQNGFVISSSGPGSVGNETNYFGSMTREAVKHFQCAKQITCSGNESTTGYGRVGPTTRGVLNSL